MSNSGWNPAGFVQPGGVQGQQQVGGVKMFDPTQFSTALHQQPQAGGAPATQDGAQQQPHSYAPNSSTGVYFNPQTAQDSQSQAPSQGSAWANWGGWNWNSQGQNAELSGQPAANTTYDVQAGSDDVQAGSNVDGEGEQQGANQVEQHQQFHGQFANPLQYQNGGCTGNQNGGYTGDGYHQHWQSTDHGNYYYDQSQGQWVPDPRTGENGGQTQLPGQDVTSQVQHFYQGQQEQPAYFDPTAWNTNPGGDSSQAGQWENSYDVQGQVQGYDHLHTGHEAGSGDLHTEMQSPEAHSHPGTEKLGFQSPKVAGNVDTPQSVGDGLDSGGASGLFATQGLTNWPPVPILSTKGGSVDETSTQNDGEQRVGGHTRGSSIDSSTSGTMAGFFGHGDSGSQSEASATNSPRRGDGASAVSHPIMKHLKVAGLQRTDSGISNAGLQTLNLSADEDTKDSAEDLAEQMGHLHLGGNVAMQNAPSTQLYDHPGDFSGFGNYSAGPSQQGLIAHQEGAIASESQESDEQSPVGNDWEIVPPQTQSSTSHSRTSSLDDGIKFTPHGVGHNMEVQIMHTEKPAGGNPEATHSSSTQDSESFTAISSTSSSGETYSHSSVPFSDRGTFQPPSVTSTPLTSPGAQSNQSQVSPLSSLQSSPLVARQPPSVGTPPSTLPSPALPARDRQQQQQSSSATSSAASSPRKTASQTSQSQSKDHIDQPLLKENSPEGVSLVSKPADTLDEKSGVSAGLPAKAGGVQRGKPPPSPGPRGGSHGSPEKDTSRNSSPRRHHSAFQPVHSHRAKHNMSPATTLWDNLDTAPTSNILLAPAAPLIIPSLGTSSANSAKTTTTSSSAKPAVGSHAGKSSSSSSLDRLASGRRATDRVSGSRHETNNRRGSDRKEGERSDRNKGDDLSRSREDDNRSLGSLDELDAAPDYSDDSRDRGRKDAGYDPYYDRSSSRTDTGRDDFRRPRDPRDKYRSGYGRDYRDPYYDERYERPRSRQEEERASRPSSRSARELDRPASRSEYDRDRDAYYQHQRDARYKGGSTTDKTGYPGYDVYNQDYYYDERERYYLYYTDSRYRRGYAEEMGYYGQHDSSKSAKKSNDDKKAENQPSSDYYNRTSSRPSSRMDRERDRDPYRQGYAGYEGYDPYAYYDQYQYQYPYYQFPQQHGQKGYERGRMTPPKYILPHVRVCFGPTGQLVTVLPSRPAEGQPATVEIHDVQVMLQNNPEAEVLQAFPGPLVRTETHKNDVLLLCQKKARECAENIDMVDRESAELIWRLLELLLKQNGSIIGTDIADLLLAGHELTTHEYTMSGMRIVPSADQLDATEADGSSRGSSPAVRVSADRTVITAAQQMEEATDRFRHLLLYGRKKEALDLAMKRNLWGHALFLASKMDNRTHASVMTRFANTAMRMNDPLQTLYQLMSGRQPASVTNVHDERWGDWRPHLAMILSNHSSRPELDKKSIITLGDTLASKHCLHASHFCYLMAQVEFGSFMKKTSKIVLIGSNHNLPLEEFSNNSTIQCTEVYEYAQTLGNTKFCLPQFQVYKFLYACRLADCGLSQEAFHYCEIIAQQVVMFPARYRPTFVTILYTLASRLKLCDPQKLHDGYDSADPVWLQQLASVCQNYEEGSLQYKSGSATPMTGYGAMTPSSEGGEVASYETGGAEQYGQVTGNQYGQASAEDQYNWQQQQYDPSQYQQQQWQNYDPNQAGTTEYSQGYVAEQNATAQQGTTGYYQGTGAAETGAQQHHQQPPQQQQLHPPAQPGFGGFVPQQPSGPRGSLTEEEEGDEDDDDDGDDDVDAQPTHSTSQFDYFGAASQQQKIVAPPHRYRTTSTSSAGSSGRRRKRTMSGSSTGSVRAANPSKQLATNSKPSEGKKDAGQKGGGAGGGWFNGLFSKFGRSNKNEMILPDDKNPAIVWDPVKKKWMNKDGEEDETTIAAPPPKDADLMGKMSAPPGAVPPSSGTGPVMNGPPGGNRFSLGRGRGTRGQYVDVLNPGGTTNTAVPPSLFNVLPSAAPAATNTAAAPQLLNPSGAASKSTSHTSVPSSQTSNALAPPSQDAQEFGDSDPVPTSAVNTNQPPALPMLFNPSQLSQSGRQAASSAVPGLKYGNRRVYPK